MFSLPPDDRNDRVPALHEARDRDARARERPRDLRHARRARAPRRTRGLAGSGIVCGGAGLLLADLFTSLDYTALTFLVIPSLAAALIGRLRSLWVTLAGRLAVGLLQAIVDAVCLGHGLPHGGALRARDHRAAVARPPSHRHALADGGLAHVSLQTRRLRGRRRGASSGGAAAIAVSLAILLFVLPASSAPTGSRP